MVLTIRLRNIKGADILICRCHHLISKLQFKIYFQIVSLFCDLKLLLRKLAVMRYFKLGISWYFKKRMYPWSDLIVRDSFMFLQNIYHTRYQKSTPIKKFAPEPFAAQGATIGSENHFISFQN